MSADIVNPKTFSRRVHRRGAILVESLIVVGFTAFMLAVGIYFHFLYVHKLFTMRQARQQAWSAASPGCNGGVTNGVFNSAFSLIDLLSGHQLDQLPDSPLSRIGRKDGSTSSTVLVPSLLHSWGYSGPNSMSLTSSTRVACNELTDAAPKDASGVGIFKWGWNELVGKADPTP
jgi:hypothetical protein